MNEFQKTLNNAYGEYLAEVKKAVDGVSKAELYSQPNPDSNNMGWIVWHMARVEDYWINGTLAEGEQVWNSEGWDEKFGMDPENRGAGQTIEEVMSMPQIEAAELLAYFDAVRAQSSKVIDNADDALLAKDIEHPRFGKITGGWIVSHIIVEESQHTGQVALIRGMMRGFGK